MRSLRLAVLFGAVWLSGFVLAQDEPLHAPDGGTRQQLQSLYIMPTPNAPFSAVVQTEWTRILPDGSKSTIYNHRKVARDSSGRVFQERRYLTPNGNTVTTPLSLLQYDDPNRHERLLCHPTSKVCEQTRLFVPKSLPPQPVGPLPNGAGTLTREDLGRRQIDSVDAVGTREVTTLNAGVFGNEKPQPIVKEFWYSPQLHINLVTQRFDPRASSAQNITATNLNLSEPDPRLFEPPEGFRVVSTEAP